MEKLCGLNSGFPNECGSGSTNVKTIEIMDGYYYENGNLSGKVISFDGKEKIIVIDRISDNKYMNGIRQTINFIEK